MKAEFNHLNSFFLASHLTMRKWGHEDVKKDAKLFHQIPIFRCRNRLLWSL